MESSKKDYKLFYIKLLLGIQNTMTTLKIKKVSMASMVSKKISKLTK